jgi:hypothetical protein
MCHPGNNRILLFDAKYLHGVIPGKGMTPAVGSRRLTFMIGFWKKICARDRGLDCPGPGQPYPDLSQTKYTWPKELAFSSSSKEGEDGLPSGATSASSATSFDQLVDVEPPPVSAVWEPVDPKRLAPKPCYNQCFQGF